jgi:uncharacterized protein (DUF58 family)
LCTADYSVDITPQLRGHYPVTKPQVTCSFPFGIWTARRELLDVKPLTVWPKVYPVLGMLPLVGHSNADQGDGSRGGRTGDFVGVRGFRRGDSARHVNWIASARSDSLIVTERGGPQSVEIEVLVDTRCHADRESLARRIRVAASVLSSLHRSRIATKVRVGERAFSLKLDSCGRRKMLDLLASVPADGQACDWNNRVSLQARISISGSASGDVQIRIDNPLGGRRAGGASREIMVATRDDLAYAMANLWNEVRDADVAA